MIKNKITIDFIPVHNPEGYLENQRDNKKGINLNRNFPYGNVKVQMEPETKAIVNLINTINYNASLFLHSANEDKYENLVRTPIELNKLGPKALKQENQKDLIQLQNIVIKAGNSRNPDILWHSSSEMVDLPGIASDWCESGFVKKEYTPDYIETCKKSHPSLTIELCFPKQPMDEERLISEKQELYTIITALVNKF